MAQHWAGRIPVVAALLAFPTPAAAQVFEAPPERPPAHLLEEPDFVRRQLELVPHLSLALPRCASGNRSDDRCSGVGPGLSGGFGLLWRPISHVALGGSMEVAGFQNEPPTSAQRTKARAGAAFVHLVARLYVAEHGGFDPYLELGIGGGALGTSAREPTPGSEERDRFEETGAGPSLRAGVGFDFFVSPRLRLGPHLRYTQVLVDKIRRCSVSAGEECADLSPNADGHLSAMLSVGLSLSVLLGSEL